ncbi:LamG-like jellyroll fold domain-containing protein [Streptomyces griseoflavus]|uniref:LamG-like jellyroll fold domain-containing protein n=1 Tax=Streptomyces griseoflavus TaxID=35619 RepID=UPI0033C97815
MGVALAFGLTPALTGEAVAGVPASPRNTAEAEGAGGLTEADAMAMAKKTGEPVEIASLRGEASEVFATPDGQLQAREYLRPVWTRDRGGWVRIDTDLTATKEGAIAPKASATDLEFSGGGESPLVRMRRAGRELSLTWPTPLPKPTVEGPEATYPSVLPGVDLRMTAQEDGFTQLLVVKSAEAAASPELTQVRLALQTQGLSVEETNEGGLHALDKGSDAPVFEAPRPVMWDSSPGEAPAGAEPDRTAQDAESAVVQNTAAATTGLAGESPGAGESGKLAPVGVEVPDGQNELVLTPDAEMLKGEDTTYPVFIDPQWYSPKASAWTMVSKYWASSPQWKFNGDSDSGMGYCNWNYCKPNDTKRLFYRLPVSKFAGRSILSAEFVVRNTWSASCSARGVQLWRTKDISSSTTWNSQNSSGFWIDHLQTSSFAYGHDGCAAKDAEFNVKSAVQQAANGKWSTMTFGLRASSETDGYGWKRFSDDAFLRVEYNRPPPQVKMSQLTMEYGGACKSHSAPARIRTLGKLYADNVTDPDGDTVAVQFQAKWDSGDGKGLIVRWSPKLTSYKKSGSNFSITMPSVPANKTAHWYVRSHDGAQYSPWSTTGDPTACYFVYDTAVPRAPAVSSGEYPASDPDNPEDPWYDGVGKYGFFDIKAADTDVTKYWFGINSDPTSKNSFTTTSGAAKTAPVLPAKPGLNFFTAQAFDAAGNGSEVRTYQFRVKAGQPERATWQFDEGAGATQAVGSAGARTAMLHGNATMGAEGKKGTALHVDGASGYAATDIPTVNTANGFSVSAWVKLDEMPTDAAVVAAQPGNHSPGFELYYSLGYNRWVFNQYTSDTPGASIARAMAPQAGGVSAGDWTHLVGVYSGGDKELRLYVNGTLAGATPYTTAWDARRGLQIGAANLNGRVTNYFPGTIDELRLFDKPVSATEVTRLYGLEPIGNGRTARAVFGMDEEAGATETVGYADTQPLKLVGGAQLGTPGVARRALSLNGSSDYAHTTAPHADTQRPFTISAWARLDRTPDQAATIVAQLGQNRPGFELYYSKTHNRWGFTQYSADVAGATQIRALQPDGTTARVGEWVHLVGVHDAVAETLTLYVNGAKAGSVAQTKPWYAGGRVQVGALSIDGGRLIQYFPGQIDDVRVFDRPVSADEVGQLFRQRPLVKGRWLLDETTTTSPITSPDASAENRALILGGGAKTGAGWVDDGALELDGIDDHAATAAPVVDTSASFTVMGWAQSAGVPTGSAAVLSMPGAASSAFTVRHVPAPEGDQSAGRWQLSIPDSDAAGATVVSVENSQFYDARDWNHLTIVYDGFTKEARLYVNGELEEVACADTDGDGESDNSTCADRMSWSENVLSYKAAGGLQIGRARTSGAWGEYWPGAVDDVWVFQGALSELQIARLSLGWPGAPTEVPGTD